MIARRNPRAAWLLVAAGLIAVLGVVLLENLGSLPLNALTLRLPGIDKVLHFMQSFAICYVLSLLLGRTGISAAGRISLAAAGALAAAGLDELQQSLRADRNVEVADIGAGAAGIVSAIAVLSFSRWRRLATVAAVVGVVAATAITYDSYLRARDYNRGLLAERAGRPEEALRHYLAGAESGVNNPEVYNAAAWLIAESPDGDPRRAVALAARSLQLRPQNPDALDTYGWSLYRAGRGAEAVAPLQAALAAKPDIYCIHYHLGMVYLSLNRREEAVQHLQQQVDLMPTTREANLAAETLTSLNQSVRSQ